MAHFENFKVAAAEFAEEGGRHGERYVKKVGRSEGRKVRNVVQMTRQIDELRKFKMALYAKTTKAREDDASVTSEAHLIEPR